MRRILSITLALLPLASFALGVHLQAYSRLVLIGVGQAPGSQACDLVSGCIAAYSLNRRLVASYSGNLFQLSRTSDNTTQNIGQSGTNADLSAVQMFCGSNNANGCAVRIAYDQTGNSNDATCAKLTGAIGTSSTTCTTGTDDLPLSFDGSWGGSMVLKIVTGQGGASNHYLQKVSGSNIPTGARDKSVVVVSNDVKTSECCMVFGLGHATDAGTTNGTDFGAMLRANGGNATNHNCRLFGIDLEIDVQEVCYAADDPQSYSTLTETETLSAAGKFVGVITYTAGSKSTTSNFNGEHSYTTTYSTGITCSGANCDNQIRIGAGGDGTPTKGVWYEGILYNVALNAANQATLMVNAQNYYGISTTFPCTATNTIASVLGETNVTTGGGFRLINPHYRGPLAILHNIRDNTYKAIGASGCNFDTATAAKFCGRTTCDVYQTYNQFVGNQGHLESYVNTLTDPWLFIRPVSGTSPGYTASCTNSLPCMTARTSQNLEQQTAQTFAQPYSIFIVAKNTGATNHGAPIASKTNFHPYLGRNASANTALFQADDSGGASCSSCAMDGTFYGLAGTADSSTAVSVYVNGSRTTATGVTVTSVSIQLDIPQQAPLLRINFAGSLAEWAIVLGSAVSSDNVNTIHADQKTYWGY
jgi:hypothetical protein